MVSRLMSYGTKFQLMRTDVTTLIRNSKYSYLVMDAFHVGRHVIHESLGDERAERLLDKVIDFNNSKAKLYFDSMMSGDDLSTREMKILSDELAYFRRNWKAVRNRHTAGFVGAHMERQVSHILAIRMSMRPMS